MTHRCGKLDMLIGKRLKITFSDGIYVGKLAWDETEQSYKLTNCVDMKKGFLTNDRLFRKSQAKTIERI